MNLNYHSIYGGMYSIHLLNDIFDGFRFRHLQIKLRKHSHLVFILVYLLTFVG